MTTVNKFATERVRDDLNYISERVGIGSALMVSDYNFGMLPDDLDPAKYMGTSRTCAAAWKSWSVATRAPRWHWPDPKLRAHPIHSQA